MTIEKITEVVRSMLEGETVHDFSHTLRVRTLCLHISGFEGGDPEILEASALLHDIGRPIQSHDPQADHASISAELAPGILTKTGFPVEKIADVVAAVASHRYSAGMTPASQEARILQDADRLDISGAVGAAMTFAYSGATGRRLYDPDDPLAEHREPDGRQFALDHILSKLLMLPGSMHTTTARDMAVERNNFLKTFIEQMIQEIKGT